MQWKLSTKTLKLDRELPILEMAVGFMKQRDGLLGQEVDCKSRLLTRTNTAVMRSEMQGIVQQINNNVFTIDLEAKEWSYIIFQDNGIPCGYAKTCIFARPGRDLIPFIPEILSIVTWKRIYIDNFPLIDIPELQPLQAKPCHLPLTRVPCGRPKKERFRKEEIRGLRSAATADQLTRLPVAATTRCGGRTTALLAAVGDSDGCRPPENGSRYCTAGI